MLAVIEIGGKQYLVKEGSKIITNKLNKQPGEEIAIDKILLLAKDGEIEIGKPYVGKCLIKGRVSRNIKKKTLIIKFKPKTRYRKKKGYKHYFDEVIIEEIKILKT